MHTQQVSSSELLVTFDDFSERERFIQRRKFRRWPGGGVYARWVSEPGGGDPTHQLEMLPANLEQGDDPQVLAMRIIRYRA